VIRLVTQFDSPKARVAAVTPTCSGACCCCCCCIVTLIGATVLTPWDVQAMSRRARVDTPERIRWCSPWPAVLGALTAPLVVAVALFTWWTVIVPWGLWFLLVGLAYWGAGHARPWRRGALVATLGVVAVVVEFIVWAAILFSE
jgi:hypothetical protein